MKSYALQEKIHSCFANQNFERSSPATNNSRKHNLPHCLTQNQILMNLQITSQLFDDYINCPTKCYLRFIGEPAIGNPFADWINAQSNQHRREGIKLFTIGSILKIIEGQHSTEYLKKANWELAVGLMARSHNLESFIQVLERVSPSSQSQPAQFTPIRFTFTNKPSKNDKLLLAFDALVLSELLGRDIRFGKIILGEGHIAQKVKIAPLTVAVKKLLGEIATLISINSCPDLILNRHCVECVFQGRCRKIAVEKDDLSLLSGMSEKERKKFRSKGIFTITHLSYTFRPRRKSKRFSNKGEKYHSSLKALAIRERKIHVVGSEKLKIEGTPIYLDVEGIPYREFYYLIGIRFKTDKGTIQHNLWADTPNDEKKIWSDFIDILSAIQNPVLIHYGSFETSFFKSMCIRYGGPGREEVEKVIHSSVNLLSFIYARIYFPTFTNGLKEVAGYLGFNWSEVNASGFMTILWRTEWEKSRNPLLKEKLTTYNREDCEALCYLTKFIDKIMKGGGKDTDIVHTDSMPREGFFKFRKNQFQLTAMEEINRTAYWHYQREKIILRSSKRLKKKATLDPKKAASFPKANKIIRWPSPENCLRCGHIKLYRHRKDFKEITDMQFGRAGIKRWIKKYVFYRYRCPKCGAVFHNTDQVWSGEKYGQNLIAMSAYLNIDLRISQGRVASFLNQVLGLNLSRNVINKFKGKAAILYKSTYENLVQKIIAGGLIQADETHINLEGKEAFVWTLTSLEDVVYFYTPSREGDLVRTLLQSFKGVLITDFYSAYDSINCPQQKCLIHLIRDLNDDLMKEPFNEEIKTVITDFADLLKRIVETVDRFGLKARFLRKHKIDVSQFYKRLSQREHHTETAAKIKKRFEKNRVTLFTFLDYDGVPWNNNNAEHAIKAVTLLRRDLGGASSEKGIKDYLILLSICETCRFKGVSFLEFLRSGEKDINAFVTKKLRRAVPQLSPSPSETQ